MKFPHLVVTKRAPLVTDSKGNQLRDWVNAATSRNIPAWVQPLTSAEQTLNQDRVVSRWRIFLDPAADVQATDRVVWNGRTFQVDGEIQAWDNGYGTHHLEGFLRSVTG